MIRVHLTPEWRDAVQTLRHDPTLRPAERDRVEMVLLSAAGWSPPRIARYIGCHPATVRQTLKRIATTDPTDLRWRRPGPPKDAARRQQVTAALDQLLSQERTWTAAQLAEALQTDGIALSARQTRKYLKVLGARWRRTVATLKHKHDPAHAVRAGRVLDHLKKSRPPATSGWPTSTSVASAPVSR